MQVYLDASDRERLDRLTGRLHATKSDVFRRALAALEGRLVDPHEDPATRLVGIPGEHDRALAAPQARSWSAARDEWPGV